MEKEKEAKSQRGHNINRATEDFGLQWGNRKRLRCVKVKDQSLADKSDCLGKKKITSRVDRRVVGTAEKGLGSPQLQRLHKNSDLPMNNRKATVASPDKEDRYYTTRGSLGLDDNGKVLMDHVKEDRGFVWPKLFITLSSKEKEEDFMAMKGCKLPQRPKKRAKLIQKSLLLVSPGAWLSDLCQERYEVREKKASKKEKRRKLNDILSVWYLRFGSKKQKNPLNLSFDLNVMQRPRGLKAMGSMDSESE